MPPVTCITAVLTLALLLQASVADDQASAAAAGRKKSCTKKHKVCHSSHECCSGLQCGTLKTCMVESWAVCATVCAPSHELSNHCIHSGNRCNSNHLDCCGGLSCQHKDGHYVCKACKSTGKTCNPGVRNQCCPYNRCAKRGRSWKCVHDHNMYHK